MQQLILNIEKLSQFRKILQDMKAGYEILVKGYQAVQDISEGNFMLHKHFLDGLLEVSPAVRKYYKVGEIVEGQLRLVKETKQALQAIKGTELISEAETAYWGRIVGKLIQESWQSADQLTLVVTAGKLRMSDEERLAAIDAIHEDMKKRKTFLRAFQAETAALLMQRTRALDEAERLRQWFK